MGIKWRYSAIDTPDTYKSDPMGENVDLKVKEVEIATGSFQCFKNIFIPSFVIIPMLTVLEIKYYGTDSSQHQNGYRGVPVVRVSGWYTPILVTEYKHKWDI